MKLVAPLAALIAAAIASPAAVALGAPAAAAYPEKPIRLVITYPPGGNTDLIGRAIAQKLTEAWGQQVIVDNRGGEMLKAMAAINIVHVPYKGGAASITDLIAGQVQLADPQMAQRFQSQGGDPASSTPAELTAYMREESARWTQVIKTAGIKIE